MKTIISNPQNRVKDCYAPAPRIDLTLRSNGEEEVSVIDSVGRIYPCRIDAPTTAPTFTGFGAGSFEPTSYYGFRYVYVAKAAFPLVENAVTGGGSPAPRSNPSPSATFIPGSNSVRVKVPTTSSSIITHIWVYRTNGFDTSAEAKDFADAGAIFWVGEVANNPNLTTVDFIDDGSQVGQEQIETDNFSAPQFQFCVFADPYFYGFGNYRRAESVNVSASGLITLLDPNAKWFTGRNGQIVTFEGIQSGGFDNNGKFYIKILSLTTAQCYLDASLTIPGGAPAYGDTVAYIEGLSTTLFQSKPRNPFSWGFTDVVGDTQVPSLRFYTVGGKSGTALAVIPNQNLLKVDVSGPPTTYTFNLKNAGTPAFEDSRRIIADRYCSSSHFAQFSATVGQGRDVLWSIDSKSYAIIECDGTNQQPISDKVSQTMRTLSLAENDQLFFHGVYDPMSDMNCMFVRTQGLNVNNVNMMIGFHWPTQNWTICDVYDVLCSASVTNKVTGQTKTIVGSERGMLGELFSPEQNCHWFTPYIPGAPPIQRGFGTPVIDSTPNQLTTVFGVEGFLDGVTGDPLPALIGNWMQIIQIFRNTTDGTITKNRWLCRIATVANIGNIVTFDQTYFQGNQGWIAVPFVLEDNPLYEQLYCQYYIGLIEMVFQRVFTAALPFSDKKIDEVLTSWIYPPLPFGVQTVTPPFITYFGNYPDSIRDEGSELHNRNPSELRFPIFEAPSLIPVDYSKVFGILVRDRNYLESCLLNYELRMSNQDGRQS